MPYKQTLAVAQTKCAGQMDPVATCYSITVIIIIIVIIIINIIIVIITTNYILLLLSLL